MSYGRFPRPPTFWIASETLDIFAPLAHRLGTGPVAVTNAEHLAETIGRLHADGGLVSIAHLKERGTRAFIERLKGEGISDAPTLTGVEIVAVDRGPGFNINECLADGFSTGGTQGTGLGALMRLLVLGVYAVVVVRALGLPSAPALVSLAAFFFLAKFTEKPLRFFGLVGSGFFAAQWVTLFAGEYGISPGQACVFYADDSPEAEVLGGGFIAEAVPAALVA